MIQQAERAQADARNPALWMNLATTLRVLGQRAECERVLHEDAGLVPCIDVAEGLPAARPR